MSEQIIVGIHAVTSIIATSPQRIKVLWLQQPTTSSRLHSIVEAAKANGITIENQPRSYLDTIAKDLRHQGVIAKVTALPSYTENDLPAILATASEPLLLILDGVQDPHNLGACLRTADATGVTAVIAPKDRAVGITATVSKVACGAAETIPFIAVTNLARTLKWLQQQGVWLHGTAEEEGQALYQTNLTGPIAWVFGGEEKGMRRLTREHCDVIVSIPMAGSVPSLNVSVATAVCLYETLRQRQVKANPSSS